ncbi:MAG: PAAR domain-containing protein [Selenomonadaceae bacterium]|nr:PAAR domain-containing protein [Selenomonadaceae bacterium]
MPKATRISDNCTGHDACPPRPLVEGSPNVFINGRRQGRVGDSYTTHSCPEHVPHTGVISAGSRTVFINRRQAGRVGDPVSCGSSVAQGSPDVFIGG